MFTKFVSGLTTTGSSPLNLKNGSCWGMILGLNFFTFSEIAFMCAGVVPQQPPTRFINPLSANSSNIPEVIFGVSSYSPISLGKPAFG